ncbi:MAG: tRNA (adenosine(37)-N6)-threonylcarbamoyltransferase complex ATPase subunit type 1 TsaE [Flavobacteriaceae bacterium]|nr:tRNA (adenosine(37)-N6)-threonylcarbamoyltransferase complex ATPase subunit type 1 TsaE [Flavobacteriaceae bacterium]
MIREFTLNQIDSVAKDILQNIESKTILFYGNMGTGKTTLISALVKALGGEVEASSPTFSIVNEYEVSEDKVYHFDFYRLDNFHEALDIGIEDYFGSKHWIFIEWPERINEILPSNVDISYIFLNKNNSRTLKLNEKLLEI